MAPSVVFESVRYYEIWSVYGSLGTFESIEFRLQAEQRLSANAEMSEGGAALPN